MENNINLIEIVERVEGSCETDQQIELLFEFYD